MSPTCSPYGIFTLCLPGTKHFSRIFIYFVIQKKLVKVFVAQSCLTLCNTVACSLPNTSVHGIPQARILKWVPIPFSRGSSPPKIEPGSPALQADSLPSEPPGTFLSHLIPSQKIMISFLVFPS